jgi:hypothetical protein
VVGTSNAENLKRHVNGFGTGIGMLAATAGVGAGVGLIVARNAAKAPVPKLDDDKIYDKIYKPYKRVQKEPESPGKAKRLAREVKRLYRTAQKLVGDKIQLNAPDTERGRIVRYGTTISLYRDKSKPISQEPIPKECEDLFDANEALRDAIDARLALAPGTAPAPNVTQRIREAVRTAERTLADYNRRTEECTTKDTDQLSLAFDALPRLKAVVPPVRGAGNTADPEHAAETSSEEKMKHLEARLTSLRPADDAFGTELTEDVAYNVSWANELLAD